MFRSRYVSEKLHQDNLRRQILIYPKVLGEIRSNGINEHAVMKLNFFFYTNRRAKAEKLKNELLSKGYELNEVRKSLSNRKWMVSGFSKPIQMEVGVLGEWSHYMCEAGYQHDCFFDYWDVERS